MIILQIIAIILIAIIIGVLIGKKLERDFISRWQNQPVKIIERNAINILKYKYSFRINKQLIEKYKGTPTYEDQIIKESLYNLIRDVPRTSLRIHTEETKDNPSQLEYTIELQILPPLKQSKNEN